jgi:hypothetical protein
LKARALIDNAPYPGETLPAISQAYDAAWAEIAWIFEKEPAEIEKAREQLARALLSIVAEQNRSIKALKIAALYRMALNYMNPARRLLSSANSELTVEGSISAPRGRAARTEAPQH